MNETSRVALSEGGNVTCPCSKGQQQNKGVHTTREDQNLAHIHASVLLVREVSLVDIQFKVKGCYSLRYLVATVRVIGKV